MTMPAAMNSGLARRPDQPDMRDSGADLIGANADNKDGAVDWTAFTEG